MPRSFAVIIDECAAPSHSNARQVNFRDTSNAAQNFKVTPAGLVQGLPRELEGRELDWLHLVCALYATDLVCDRANGDVGWARDIELHVAVRDPAYWQAYVVGLQEIFADLTHDRITLHLHEDPAPPPPPRYGTAWEGFDCVALLSGGLDSHTGALELLAQGRRPLLLSHGRGANTTPQAQSRAALARVGGGELPHARLSTEAVKGLFPQAEESQRARSILFMGAAALLAAVAGQGDIFLNENGVMAVHVPLSAARIGSLSTKTAYPPIVERMATLAASALATPLQISNLLIDQTKPEVVARAVALGSSANELAATASCWAWHRARRHCGICVPCLTRRISFEHAGITEPPHEADPLDVAADAQAPFAHDNLVHLCGALQHLDTADDLALELDHPELLDGGSQLSPPAAMDLYRRWARQGLDVLQRHRVSAGLLA